MLAKQAKNSGFTLLEMVIAMAIFAVIMIIVMGGLNMVMRAQEQVSVRAKRLGEIQMAMAVLARDLRQIVARPIRDNNGELKAALIVDRTNEIRLEFTTGGLINPGAVYQRSSLQRVGYGLENNTLVRYIWPVLDRATNTTRARRHLLPGVVGFDIQYMNARGELISTDAEAVALYIDVDLGNEGHLQRTFAIRGEVVNAPQS
jgi:general secretion pathway protein J